MPHSRKLFPPDKFPRPFRGGGLACVCASIAFVGLLVSATVGAARVGAGNGQEIARQWCAECHIVAADQAKAVEGVPSFQDIGKRLDDEQIRAALYAPHPPMPNFDLGSEAVDALIAYIRRQAQ